MTAVVGILNKQAVALAADSAATISGQNNRKILNRANKIFMLSKFHPVGIMIYNSASFMSTPLETIIKVYRKKLGAGSFNTVKEYQEDFIKFLRDNDFFTDEETRKNNLRSFSWSIIEASIGENAVEKIKDYKNSEVEQKKSFLEFMEKQLDKFYDFWINKSEKYDEFLNYDLPSFSRYVTPVLDELYQDVFKKNDVELNEDVRKKIIKTIHAILLVKENISSYSGLIFCGFGEKEIYPHLIPVNFSFEFEGRLRYYVDEQNEGHISNKNDSAVLPFAQTDVIGTILTGIDPNLEKIYNQNFLKSFRKYNKEIINLLGDNNDEVKKQIQNIDEKVLADEYIKLTNQTKLSNYIVPLMNAVSSLSKEDLAEMAESLIYLTYLKRRITFAEESVGGPVDVAIISKGDGFIWVKRKFYFKKEMNQHFFDNYFK